MAKSKSTRPLEGGKTINRALIELRCSRARDEISRVRRLLRVAAGAVVAEQNELDGFALPEDAIPEVLELAWRQLDAIEGSLDSLKIKAEPTKEEQERITFIEKIDRKIEQDAARRTWS